MTRALSAYHPSKHMLYTWDYACGGTPMQEINTFYGWPAIQTYCVSDRLARLHPPFCFPCVQLHTKGPKCENPHSLMRQTLPVPTVPVALAGVGLTGVGLTGVGLAGVGPTSLCRPGQLVRSSCPHEPRSCRADRTMKIRLARCCSVNMSSLQPCFGQS